MILLINQKLPQPPCIKLEEGKNDNNQLSFLHCPEIVSAIEMVWHDFFLPCICVKKSFWTLTICYTGGTCWNLLLDVIMCRAYKGFFIFNT